LLKNDAFAYWLGELVPDFPGDEAFS